VGISRVTAIVIGGGPAGLMAAETLAAAGVAVTVYDHMPSLGRKLLMAGRGGLNLTHSEPLPRLLDRYAPRAEPLRAAIAAFPPERLIAWCEGLGQPTFVGSSGRVFPRAMKASPLLRAWLRRLSASGVRFAARRRWLGFDADGTLLFADGGREPARAVVLACGGASWPRLGSDGGWTAALPGLRVTPLRPANCGFRVAWSPPFAARFAGAPLKRVEVAAGAQRVRGEAVITADGIEGGAVYAVAATLRDTLAREGRATMRLDLRPDLTLDALRVRLAGRTRGESVATVLRKAAGLSPVAIGLVQQARHAGAAGEDLAALVKQLPLPVTAPQSLARAISTAGGLAMDELDAAFMIRARPGVFAAGEMLDWEAPTGGYLLQAALSTGYAAGQGAARWLARAD
jgi:uncharacterized flavoprotein (TIGR03862 family)